MLPNGRNENVAWGLKNLPRPFPAIEFIHIRCVSLSLSL